MTAEAKIREYVLENYLFTEDQSALDNQASFLEERIIDSTGIMEMIAFLEEEFGIEVEDDEMIPENLDSVNALVTFIDRKRGCEAA
jgi:acyl carrier protein